MCKSSQSLLDGLHGESLSFFESFFEGALHVESGFWVVVSLSFQEGFESFDGFLELDEFALSAGEDLGHEEWLRQELLDLSGSGDCKLVVFGQLVHTQNGDNILQWLVVLEELLNTSGDCVMLLTDNGWVQDSWSWIQWIDGWVDTEFGQGSWQHSCGVQEGEGCGWGGIGKIVGWYVYGLDWGNWTLLGGGDSFLEGTQIGGQGWLIADGWWDTTQQGRHFWAGLGESEDVIDEQQDILSFFVSEIFSDSQTGQTDSGSGSWGFVHLSVDECASGSWSIDFDDTWLDHFVIKIISLSGSFTDTGEDWVPTVGLGDVVNKFLDDDGLSDSGTSEKSDFTTSGVGGEHINDLDTGDQDFSTWALFVEGGGFSMDGVFNFGVDGSSFIDGVADDVHDSAEGLWSDGDADGGTSVDDFLASDETLGGVHGDSSDSGVSQMLGDFEDQSVLDSFDL